MTQVQPLPGDVIETAVAAALREDLGLVGDITTLATIPETARFSATIAARQDGVLSGLPLAKAAFARLHNGVAFKSARHDGERLSAGETVAHVAGPARAILSAERVALNFLGRLSGIATLTRAYVDAVSGTGAAIVDTRKTTPGLRTFEKYAVRCGGGRNHRFGLFDAILIKDNHIAACGGVKPALEAARKHAGHLVMIEIEVDTLEQLRDVDFGIADCVLLDNMPPETLQEAVAMVDGCARTEASGGVSLETVGQIAATGVDVISVGALTHSAPNFDFGLDFERSEPA